MRTSAWPAAPLSAFHRVFAGPGGFLSTDWGRISTSEKKKSGTEWEIKSSEMNRGWRQKNTKQGRVGEGVGSEGFFHTEHSPLVAGASWAPMMKKEDTRSFPGFWIKQSTSPLHTWWHICAHPPPHWSYTCDAPVFFCSYFIYHYLAPLRRSVIWFLLLISANKHPGTGGGGTFTVAVAASPFISFRALLECVLGMAIERASVCECESVTVFLFPLWHPGGRASVIGPISF